MCISPILIKNPNYGYKGQFAYMKDCLSKYIAVPCGHCAECVHIKQLSLVQRCSLEALEGYPFFCTLTYNNESLPKVICSDNKSIRYADCSDVVNMIKRLRKDNAFGRSFRYLAVSELGSLRARPHFHLIFFVKKYEEDSVYTPINLEKILFSKVLSYWQRNYGSKRKPVYKPCCTYITKFVCGKLKSTYDLHYVVPSSVDASTMDVPFYVTKYMLKPSDKATRLQRALKLNLPQDEYDRIWKLVRPRWFSSLNFGFGVYGLQPRNQSLQDRLDVLSKTQSFRIVRQSIDRSLSSQDRPKFYDPESGKSLPLSRYWKSFGNLYTVADASAFHYKDPNWREDNMKFDDRFLDEKDRVQNKYESQLRLIDNNSANLNLFFE